MIFNEIDLNKLPVVLLSERRRLPDAMALYIVSSAKDIVYIGATGNLRKRWLSHNKFKAINELPDVRISWLEFSDNGELLDIETEAINLLKPSLNGAMHTRSRLSNKIKHFNLPILDLIKAQNKTIYSVAKESGITYTALHRLCTKPVSAISTKSLAALCGALNCGVNEILPIKTMKAVYL